MQGVIVSGNYPPLHPITEEYPEIPPVLMDELVADIKANGQRVPVVTWNGWVIDGRHRLQACIRLGIGVRSEEAHGVETEADMIALVDSLNAHRRHLDLGAWQRIQSRRAIKAAKESEGSPHGGDRSKSPAGDLKPFTQSEAANHYGISKKSVERASAILKKSPHLVPLVESGQLSVSDAYEKTRVQAAIDGDDSQPKYIWEQAREILDKAAQRADAELGDESAKYKKRLESAASEELTKLESRIAFLSSVRPEFVPDEALALESRIIERISLILSTMRRGP